MKVTRALVLLSALFLVGGCTSYNRQTTYDPYGNRVISSSPYNTQGAAAAAAARAAEADRALAASVRQQFARYGDLSALANNVQITAQNGTIVLTGTVPTENERQMIEAMVRNTPGVLSVNDQLQVSAPPVVSTYSPNPSDLALITSVRQSLREQPSIAPYAPNIGVTADNGMVTLTGSVPSEADRQFVDSIVKNTPGVTGLIDQMRIVTLPTGRYGEPARVYSGNPGDPFGLDIQALTERDRAIAERILKNLRTDAVPSTSLAAVNINVANGKVTLDGDVQSDFQRRTIVSSVQRAAGAGNVYDNLRIVPR
jgi:osmotically-inducible protein OsmY